MTRLPESVVNGTPKDGRRVAMAVKDAKAALSAAQIALVVAGVSVVTNVALIIVMGVAVATFLSGGSDRPPESQLDSIHELPEP